MATKKKSNEYSRSSKKVSICEYIIKFICFFISMPLLILLHKILPNPDWKFNLDRILLFIATLIIVLIFLKSIKNYVITGFLISLICLIYGSFWGEYGFVGLVRDYKDVIVVLFKN